MDDLEDFLGSLQGPPRTPAQLQPAETDDEPPEVEPEALPTLAFRDERAQMPDLLAMALGETPYHPRSDRHSVIKCVGLLLDLLRSTPSLARRIEAGELAFGVNSPHAGKALDLVLGSPAPWTAIQLQRTLGDILRAVSLSPFLARPFEHLREGLVMTPLLAVEAKAVMTDHAGALPRLTDELERFRHRFPPDVQTVGLVLVNVSPTFLSPLRGGKVTHHRQPHDAQRVMDALADLPLHIGMLFLDCPNDGRPPSPRAFGPPEAGYPTLVQHLAQTLH